MCFESDSVIHSHECLHWHYNKREPAANRLMKDLHFGEPGRGICSFENCSGTKQATVAAGQHECLKVQPHIRWQGLQVTQTPLSAPQSRHLLAMTDGCHCLSPGNDKHGWGAPGEAMVFPYMTYEGIIGQLTLGMQLHQENTDSSPQPRARSASPGAGKR